MRRRRNTVRHKSIWTTATLRARALTSKSTRRKRARGPRRVFVVVLVVLLSMPVAGYGACELVKWLHRAPHYVVTEIRVEGARLFTPAEVLEKAKLEPGEWILDYRVNRARRALVKDPMIRAAVVERRLPNTLVVHITERTPIATLRSRGTDYLVDEDGFLLTEGAAMATLPEIEGVSLKNPKLGAHVEDKKLATALEVLNLYMASPMPSLMEIETVNVRNLRNVRLYPRPGAKACARAVISLGDGQYGQQLARLDEVLRAESRPVKKVDLRPERVVVITN